MNDYGVLTAPDTVRFERVLPGPIERVWAYLTESEKRGRWLASGEMKLRPGGSAEFHFKHQTLSPQPEAVPDKYRQYENGVSFSGRVVRSEPPRLLVFTWPEEDGTESEVTFELAGRGDEVLLTLTHRRLRSREVRLSVAAGWHTHLGILADRLAGREPRPFWSTHARLEAEYEGRFAKEPV